MVFHSVPEALQHYRGEVQPLLGTPLSELNATTIDLSRDNPLLQKVNISNTEELDQLIKELLGDADHGIGGYGEHREWYQRSPLFGTTDKEARCIHLGIDLWAPATTPIQAPLSGHIHSLADNDHFGDYGGTIILAHEVAGMPFYTLYGHLSKDSLTGREEGDRIKGGEEVGRLGMPEENGYWPPHLHFQLILDMEGRKGDFPGVCTLSDRSHFLTICPDPSVLIR